MDIKNTRFSSIEQITGQYLNNRNVRQTDKENVSSFDTILKQKFDDVIMLDTVTRKVGEIA